MHQLKDALNTHLTSDYRLQQALEVIELQGVTLGNQITEIAALKQHIKNLEDSLSTLAKEIAAVHKSANSQCTYFLRPY